MARNSLGVNISQPAIPVFQGNNCGVWSTKIKTLFISQDLWELVEKGYSEEAATKVKEAWDALKNGYQGTTRVLTVKLQTLRRQFKSFRMKEGESIHDFSNNLMVIVNQMRTYGEQITYQKVVEKLLRSLTRKYESTVSAIEEHKSYEENATEKAFQAKLKFPKENTTGHERSGNYIRGSYSYRGRRSGRGGGQSSDRQQHSVDGIQTPNHRKFILACYATDVCNSDVWYMDSGSSSHMTKKLEAFISLNRSAKTRIKMADGTIHHSEGKGVIQLNSGQGCCIKDDYSCAVFTDKTKKNLLLKVPMAKNNMFPLVINDEKKALAASLEDDSWLWHHRYGHLNFKSLSLLSNQNLVDGLPMIRRIDAVCESCVVGKQHSDPFSKSSNMIASKPAELIHADVCGPMQTLSLNNSRYFVVFVDDFSRMTWVYFVKGKLEVFLVFKKFKSSIEKQSGNAVKVLRTDRGGEFVSTEFDNFCEEMGIQHQLTAKAIHAAAYVLNRSPTSTLTHLTPFEAFQGRKPKVTHFKAFVCVAHVLVPSQKMSKLDDNSVKCIFVGYSLETKGYRFYNPENKKLIISRDVVFDEKSAWKWNEMQKYEATFQGDNEFVDQQATEGNENDDEGNFSPPTHDSIYGSSSSASPSSSSSSTSPRKWRSLTEIYEQTDRCQFVQVAEPSSFDEAFNSVAWYCSKVISVVWFNYIERLRRSYRVSEVVNGAGWKRMKVGWRMFCFGRLCVGGISRRNGRNGLYFAPRQNGSTSADAHTIQIFGTFYSHKKEMALKGIGTSGSMGGKVMSDIVFELWFSTVRVSIDVVHRLVVEKVVSATSPRGKVYIAGAALRGNVQKPPKAFPSKQSKSTTEGSLPPIGALSSKHLVDIVRDRWFFKLRLVHV
ncbi:hypothetical protein GQ457_01G011000 [Hibiscus cannabinus]